VGREEDRLAFGVHVVSIAAAFKVDVEDQLASIVPANAQTDTTDDDRLFRRLSWLCGHAIAPV
jgi:hypothetical protein